MRALASVTTVAAAIFALVGVGLGVQWERAERRLKRAEARAVAAERQENASHALIMELAQQLATAKTAINCDVLPTIPASEPAVREAVRVTPVFPEDSRTYMTRGY